MLLFIIKGKGSGLYMFYDNSKGEKIYQITDRDYGNFVYEITGSSGTVKFFCDSSEDCEKLKEINHTGNFLNEVLLNKDFGYYHNSPEYKVYEIKINDESDNILNNYFITTFTSLFKTLSYEHCEKRIVAKNIDIWINGGKKKTLIRNFRNISDIIEDRFNEKIPLTYEEIFNLIKIYFIPLYEKVKFK